MMRTKAPSIELSGSLEDYLETIFQLVQERRVARVKDIAAARSVKAASVSPALRKLSKLGLVDYARREFVTLTPDGEREARRVLARHQLLTRFFEEVLQMPGKAAEEQACAMEHTLSNEGMDRLVRFFEFLRICPNLPPEFLEMFARCPVVHEDAPSCGHLQEPGAICEQRCVESPEHRLGHQEGIVSLSELEPGEKGRVAQVGAQGAIRQRLLDMGVLPDVVIEVERVAPTGDPVWIKLHGSQIALRRKEADAIRVSVP